MARVTQITVSVGRTRSKDYNSTRIDLSETLDIEENEDPDAVYRIVLDGLKAKVKDFFAPKRDDVSTYPPCGQ